jgi:hypothetical protein
MDDPNATPVELISFNAELIKSQVQLNWQTATEVNNYGFEIEREILKQVQNDYKWKKIGFAEGHGNSNSPKEYSFNDESPLNGLNKYRLKQIDTDGSFEYSDTVEVKIEMPAKYKLSQNYPNPFNPTTTINYSIPNAETLHATTQQVTSVQVKIYNMLGQEVATLVDKKQSPGNYEVKFDASNLNSGIYFYHLKSGEFSESKKMILLK